jgi:hypothetical protein
VNRRHPTERAVSKSFFRKVRIDSLKNFRGATSMIGSMANIASRTDHDLNRHSSLKRAIHVLNGRRCVTMSREIPTFMISGWLMVIFHSDKTHNYDQC